MFSFLAILLNCTDWAIMGRIARVQFNSTLERKNKGKKIWTHYRLKIKRQNRVLLAYD